MAHPPTPFTRGIHYFLQKIQTHGLACLDSLPRIDEQACFFIPAEYLNDITIPTSHQKETSIGRDDEITWMDARQLITSFGQHTRFLIDGEDGNAIRLQAIGRIEELPVG